MTAREFWDRIFTEHPTTLQVSEEDQRVLAAAAKHFGSLSGKDVLDIGCGVGGSSLFFAERGARVTSIDTSGVAIANIEKFCRDNRIEAIWAVQLSALDIGSLGRFDFVFGSMVLHHLEPFADFVTALRATVRPGGRAFFYENSAMSSLLVWFRQHVVGRWWVPKCGDEEEFPLTPGEVDMLASRFRGASGLPRVNVLSPRFLVPPQETTPRCVQPARPDWLPISPGSGRTATASTSTSPERVERTLDEPSELGAEPFRREAPGVLATGPAGGDDV